MFDTRDKTEVSKRYELLDFDVPVNNPMRLGDRMAAIGVDEAVAEAKASNPAIVILPDRNGKTSINSVIVTNPNVLKLALGVLTASDVHVIPASQRITYGYMKRALADVIETYLIAKKAHQDLPETIIPPNVDPKLWLENKDKWDAILKTELRSGSLVDVPIELVKATLKFLLMGDYSALDNDESLQILAKIADYLQEEASIEESMREQVYQIFGDSLGKEAIETARTIGKQVALTGNIDTTSKSKKSYAVIGHEMGLMNVENTGLIDDNDVYKSDFEKNFIHVRRYDDPYQDAKYLGEVLVKRTPLDRLAETIEATRKNLAKEIGEKESQKVANQLLFGVVQALMDKPNLNEQEHTLIQASLHNIIRGDIAGSEEVIAATVLKYFSFTDGNKIEAIEKLLGSLSNEKNAEMAGKADRLRIAFKQVILNDQSLQQTHGPLALQYLRGFLLNVEMQGNETKVAKLATSLLVQGKITNKEILGLLEQQLVNFANSETVTTKTAAKDSMLAFRLALLNQIAGLSMDLATKKQLTHHIIEASLPLFTSKDPQSIQQLNNFLLKLNEPRFDYLREKQSVEQFTKKIGLDKLSSSLEAARKTLQQRGAMESHGLTKTWNNILLSMQKHMVMLARTKGTITADEDKVITGVLQIPVKQPGFLSDDRAWLHEYNKSKNKTFQVMEDTQLKSTNTNKQ